MSKLEKLPAIQWYPGDWRKDPGVQCLDYETRGIWFEILMIMWESETPGKLTLNGQKMPVEALSQLLGLEQAKTGEAISKLIAYGVASVEQDTGIIYNRRMLRFKEIRQKRAESGSKGGKQTQRRRQGKSQANIKASGAANQSSSDSYEDGTAVADGSGEPALSAAPGGTLEPENGRENQNQNQSRKPEPDLEPEPKRIWPEEFHCDPEFWLEKLAEHADADKQVESAVMAAGLGYEDAMMMQINFCSLKRKDEMTTPKMARAIADRCRSMIDSPRCQAERLEVVA